MPAKSAHVVARIEPEIKERAEAILADMGISASMGINMFYHQIIRDNGLPFRPSVGSARPKTLEEMTADELDERLSTGLEQAKAGMGSPVSEVLTGLKRAKSQ